MDQRFTQEFQTAVSEDLGGVSLRQRAPWILNDGLRRGDLTRAEAVRLISQLPWRREWEEHLFKECLSQLSFWDAEPELCIVLMNTPTIFHMLADRDRWSIRDRVLEDPALLREVGVGWVGGRHVNDLMTNDWLVNQAPFTHSLECIQEGGDLPVRKADEYLYARISQGLGPEENASKRTAEFLAGCHALGLEGVPILRRVQMASEMVIILIGAQPRRSQELGMDESWRPAHQQLKTLAHLQRIITDAMTQENAGLVLRWAMARHRHHQWFWQRLTDCVKRCNWRVGKVERLDGLGMGVVWHSGSRRFVVLPSEDNGSFGETPLGQTVMVAPNRTLGKPVQESHDLTVYRGVLHRFLPPTKAMQEVVDGSKS